MQKLSKQEDQLAEATSTSKVFEFFRFCLVFYCALGGFDSPIASGAWLGFCVGGVCGLCPLVVSGLGRFQRAFQASLIPNPPGRVDDRDDFGDWR